MSEELRVLVVDDEALGRQRLRELINADDTLELVGECADGEEAINAIVDKQPDLVFLDVQMPEITGFDVIDAVGPDRMPLTIFVTAHDKFALQAFEVEALDYLMKPFDDARFRQAVDRARKRGATGQSEGLSSVVNETAHRFPDRFVVRTGKRCDIIFADDVDWFEAADNYVRLHVGAATHMMRTSISQLEKRLDPTRFMRIHRSTIVNIARIKQIEPHNQTEFMLKLGDGAELTSSRKYRAAVRGLLARG